MQAYVAVEAGYGGNTTSFSVAPPFDVTGSGLVYGLNAGLLVDIPGTIFSVGPRIGWLGGQMPGSTANPVASPTFIYDVKTLWTFYQEAVVQVPLNFGNTMQSSQLFPFITASAGIAEVKTQVTGTSGGFQVTDSATRTGFTFTAGIGMPINQTIFGQPVDIYAQWREVLTGSRNVNIPGAVPDNYSNRTFKIGGRIRF